MTVTHIGSTTRQQKSTIRISEDIALPNETVTQKTAFIGTTGSGKTYAASKLAEQFYKISAQFVTLDPVGVWYGLRLAKDGKKPSNISIPVFGGLHGDVPLESTAGALLANLIIDTGISCILDVSQFESDTEKARFATDFADRLFFRKKAAPSAMHLFLEEVQEFVPQNPQRGEERMLHAFVRMQKLGRNFGIGSSYITQRPQEVNKKALNMAQTLFVFRTTGTHERNAIEKWIEDKSLDETIAQDLPKLPTGTCHVWSPEFLKVSETTRILEKETFNASATPEVGAAAKKRELAPIDLEKVRTEMAATIEKAKSEDPKLLRKRIAELERENATSKATGKPLAGPNPQAIERAAAQAVRARDAEWKPKLDEANKEIKRLADMIGKACKILGLENDLTSPVIEAPERVTIGIDLAVGRDRTREGFFDRGGAKPTSDTAPLKLIDHPTTILVPSQGLTGPEQRVLNAIAWLETLGKIQPEQALVAPLASYSIHSSNYIKSVSLLRSKGLIESGGGKRLGLNEGGQAYAQYPEVTPTIDKMHSRILSTLSGPEQRILHPLIKSGALEDDNTLAATASYSPASSNYIKSKSLLRSKGLLTSEGKAHRAADILFL